MRPLRFSINVTLDGCCDHRAIPADDGKFVLALKRAPGRWLIAADIDNSIERGSPQAPAPGGG